MVRDLLTTRYGQCEQAAQQDSCGPTRVLGRVPPTARVAATTAIPVAGEAGSWFGWSESVRQWTYPPVGAPGNRAVNPSVFVSQSHSSEPPGSETLVVRIGFIAFRCDGKIWILLPGQPSGGGIQCASVDVTRIHAIGEVGLSTHTRVYPRRNDHAIRSAFSGGLQFHRSQNPQ